MRRRLSSALILALAAAPHGAGAKDKIPEDAFAATAPAPAAPPPPNGAIFQGGHLALSSGGRDRRVGDIVTNRPVQRSVTSKSSAAGTQRWGSLGLSPPSTGPLSLFSPSDIGMGGSNEFKGKGEASQSNQLAGEISVTIAEVYPNGTM